MSDIKGLIKAAVVVDDYKVKVFKEELKQDGFPYRVTPYKNKTTIMNIYYKKDEHDNVIKMIKRINKKATK